MTPRRFVSDTVPAFFSDLIDSFRHRQSRVIYEDIDCPSFLNNTSHERIDLMTVPDVEYVGKDAFGARLQIQLMSRMIQDMFAS